MKKTLKVILEIEVEDLDEEERNECAYYNEEVEDELPFLEDYESYEFGQLIEDVLMYGGQEIFEGTDIYAKFNKAKFISSEWI